MARSLLLLAACVAACQCIENIDLQEPIVRLAPSELNDEGYFGFSVVLHQKMRPVGFDQSLQNTYLIVGAPNGTRSSSPVKNTGFVYECPITQNGQCSRISALSDDSMEPLEDKEGQFMGGAMASNGDRFIACAHRYVNFDPTNTDTRSVYGRCYHSPRSLDSFEEFQPCEGFGRRRTQSVGVCEAGMSATVAETSDGTDHIAVGAPGSYLWRGVLIRSTPGQQFSTIFQSSQQAAEFAFGWQGYSLTKGHFRRADVEDFATSVPRLRSYLGAVNILRNDGTFTISTQNLVGEQMGEYYGFSLAAANLAGDSLHELLVSAPMYRDLNIGADTGRVYVYRNVGGTLNLVTRLVGHSAYSRFGHAMVSLGDISGDGFDDVAISAPFGEGAGTVYIYHSSPSQLLIPTPQQVITPQRLNLMSSVISQFETFGTALASLDVDGNGFNDLAIGSYEGQAVTLLRTRPLAQIDTSLSADPGIVNLQSTSQMMNYDGGQYTYFEVTLSVQNNEERPINLDIALEAERARRQQGLNQRLFFEATDTTSRPFEVTEAITLIQGQSREFTYLVFVLNDIADILTGFVLELEISTGDFSRSATNGNVDPTNLDDYPVVSIAGPSNLQIEIQTDCEDPCIADLSVTRNGAVTYLDANAESRSILTVGAVTEVVIPLTIENSGRNAFLAQLFFNLPIQSLGFISIDDEVITCTPGNGNSQFIPYVCDLGNPFRASETRDIEFRFSPSSSLTGEEGNIVIGFNVTSLNENMDRLADNGVDVTLEVNTIANIFIDEGIAFPDQVNHAPSALTGDIEDVTSLGPEFTTTFTIGNNGPSTIPTSMLTIYWPLGVVNSSNFFLYPVSWSTIQSTSVSISCENTYFNPANFDIATSGDDEGNPGGLPGEGRRRRSLGGPKPRRRRRRNTRLPRQEMEEIPVSVERTVSCLPEDRDRPSNNHTCAAIVCEVRQLRAGSRVQVAISAFVDERHLGGSIDTFTFIPAAEIQTVGAGHITEQNENDNAAFAEFRSIPGTVVVTEGTDGDDETIPWYAIAIPIIVAVIFIIILGVVLYFCGFFRRKNKTEIEEQARENLAEDTEL